MQPAPWDSDAPSLCVTGRVPMGLHGPPRLLHARRLLLVCRVLAGGACPAGLLLLSPSGLEGRLAPQWTLPLKGRLAAATAGGDFMPFDLICQPCQLFSSSS